MGLYLARRTEGKYGMADNWAHTRFRDKLEGMGDWLGLFALDKSARGLGRPVIAYGGQVMHMTHTVMGGIAVIGALQLAVINNLPSLAPGPIVINSLAVTDGRIAQDRTVTGGATFTAKWSAAIINDRTGDAVPWCMGSGVWDYAPGHAAPVMSLSEWTGSGDCTLESLPPGEYHPQVLFKAGEWSKGFRGDVFRIEGE